MSAGIVYLSAPGLPQRTTPEKSVLAAEWLVLALGFCAPAHQRMRWFTLAALVVLGAWAIHPVCWLWGACMLLGALGLQDLSILRRDRSLGFALGAAAVAVIAPAVLGAVVWFAADVGGGIFRSRISEAWPEAIGARAALGANALGVWASFALLASGVPDRSSVLRVAGALAALGLAFLVVFRSLFLASTLWLPDSVQWSESPHLLNLMKLKLGVPLYGRLEDCNSYSYSPLLELVHHAILAPLGVSLSLPANRSLGLVWHVVCVAVLGWVFLGGQRQKPRGRVWVFAVLAALWVVVTSSFLAGVVHSDHLLMTGLCLAVGLLTAERRMPRWLFYAGLVTVPVFATMAKLTGAGIGLGLALAYLRPLRWRPLLVLAGSAALALCTIPLFDATLGPFSTYAILLQASHPIRWLRWPAALESPPGRLFIVALAALGVAWVYAHRRGDLEHRVRVNDAVRLAWLTVGFMIPSLVAYLKVGGRENSLLPMTVGGAAILLQIAPLVPHGLRWTVVAPWALCLLTGVAPPVHLASAAVRQEAAVRHARMVSLVRQELSQGRKTLAFGSIAAWIDAGGPAVPLDSWQTVCELELGRYPAAEAFYKRLREYYQSVIVSRHVLSSRFGTNGPHLRQQMSEMYTLVSPASLPLEDSPVPLLFRRRCD